MAQSNVRAPTSIQAEQLGVALAGLPQPCWASGLTALDLYHRVPMLPLLEVYTTRSLVDLARACDDLSYRADERGEARLRRDDLELCVRCGEFPDRPPRHRVSVLDLLYEPEHGRFLDWYEVYPDLRAARLRPSEALLPPAMTCSWLSLAEIALVVGRHAYKPPPELAHGTGKGPLLSPGYQRELLTALLLGETPWQGLELLARGGFVRTHWPELEELRGVTHSKDHHPEGDGWQHTLETLHYPRLADLTLSLALLLHDVGKASTYAAGTRKFSGHAEQGERIARVFLHRLGYPSSLIDEVTWLVRHHMLPASLPTLAPRQLEPVLGSPWFPKLLVLYRCDLASTYRDLAQYHEAVASYRRFLKHRSNPYRDLGGKKLLLSYLDWP